MAENPSAPDQRSLLPCPFCGSAAGLRGVTTTEICCPNDQCIINGAFNDYGHRNAAIDAWNTRLTAEQDGWQPMSNTAWLDGRDVELVAHGKTISARYYPGEWSRSIDGDEYDGPVWSAFDDAVTFEIEEAGSDPALDWWHGPVTSWRNARLLPAPPANILDSTKEGGHE